MSKNCPECGALIASLNKKNPGMQTFITTVVDGEAIYNSTEVVYNDGHYFCPECNADLFDNEQAVIAFFTS